MWDTWTPFPSSWLDGKPGLAAVIPNRLQLQSELLLFFQEAAGSFLAVRLFIILFFWHGEKLQGNSETGHNSLQFVFNYSQGRGGNYNTPFPRKDPQVKSALGNMHTNRDGWVFLPGLLLRWLGLSGARLPRWQTGPCLAEEAARSGEGRESCSLPLATGIRRELGTSGMALAMSIISVFSKLPSKLALKISDCVSSLALRACS